MTTFQLPDQVTGAARSYLERAKHVLGACSPVGQRASLDFTIANLSGARWRLITFNENDEVLVLSTLRQWRDEIDARRVA